MEIWPISYSDVLRHPIRMSWNITLSPLRNLQARGIFLWPGFVFAGRRPCTVVRGANGDPVLRNTKDVPDNTR